MLNPCGLERRLIFLLESVTKVLFGMYIKAITPNLLGLDRIELSSLFEPFLEPSS